MATKDSNYSLPPSLPLSLHAGGQFQLLDGDRIAALMSMFISDLLHSLPFDLSLGTLIQKKPVRKILYVSILCDIH